MEHHLVQSLANVYTLTIKETKEFVMAFPSEEIKDEAFFCGTHSGRNTDKFKETGLKAIAAKRVKPPLIDKCLANFECKVVNIVETGDHTIFVGEVVAAHVYEKVAKRLYAYEGHRLSTV